MHKIRDRDKVCQVHKAALMHGLYDIKYMCNGGLEADHLISRGNKKYRNDPDNGILLCSWHHRLSPELSHHGNKRAFKRFIESYLPKRWKWYSERVNKISKWE